MSWLTGRMQPTDLMRRSAIIIAPSCSGEFLKKMFSIRRIVDIRVDNIAGVLIIRKRHLALENNQRACLRFRHRHAGIDNTHNTRMLLLLVILMMTEQLPEHCPSSTAADIYKETFDLILKQNPQEQ